MTCRRNFNLIEANPRPKSQILSSLFSLIDTTNMIALIVSSSAIVSGSLAGSVYPVSYFTNLPRADP